MPLCELCTHILWSFIVSPAGQLLCPGWVGAMGLGRLAHMLSLYAQSWQVKGTLDDDGPAPAVGSMDPQSYHSQCKCKRFGLRVQRMEEDSKE
jgi:hypothetical protein